MADIQRYLDLITTEHSDKINFRAWLAANLAMPDDLTTLLNEFFGYFDLDAAVGVQLDTIGQILGVGRTVNFQPSAGVSPILTDDVYRIVLKARIAQNLWDGTLPGVYSFWNILFPNVYLVVADNQDMTLNCLVIGMSSSILQDLVGHGYIVPKPQGVLINYSFPPDKVFAYGLDTDIFAGYGEGYWIQYY